MSQTKLSSGAARVLLSAFFLCFSSVIGVSFAAAQATVATDKADYYPGDTVSVTGSGWAAGESVSLTFDESPVQHPPRVLVAVADSLGDIRNEEYVVEDHDLGTTFTLTAAGGTSGLTAQTTFTDSPKVGSVVVGGQSGSLCSGTAGNVTYVVTVNRGSGSGSSGNFTADLSAFSLPAGVGAAFVPNPIEVLSKDDSGTGTLTLSTSAATPSGTFTFRVKASTSATDTASTTATLQVNQGPAITCPANITLANTAGLCARSNVTYAATATGTPAPTITYSPASGSSFPVGTTTVTATATNSCGVATCSFTVTVNDTEKPGLSAHADITVSNDAGLCSAVVSFTAPTATDNCPGVGVVSSSPASGSIFPVGVTTVTSTVTDAHGNTQTSTFTVTVNDTEKPVLSAHADITASNDAGLCSAVVSFTVPTATDNCPGVGVVSSSPASGSTFPVGVTTVTSTVTDAHGNTQTTTFTVTVNDTEKPGLTVPADITVSNDAGQCSAVVSFTITASDNCPSVTYTSTPASGSAFPEGTTTVNVTATDAHGNSTTKSFTVTVNDTEKPVLSAHADITASNDAGLCSAVVSFTAPTATDNCPGVGVVSSSPASGSIFPVGVTTVTSTVTDAHGNTQTSTFTVTVNDTEKPGLTVPADITVSNDAGQCSAVVSFTITASDNCPGVTYTSTPVSGSTFPEGTTTVNVTATDAHGNSTTKSFTVTVNDTEKPVLSAHADITASNDAGLCSAVVSFTAPTATDNCPGVGVVSSSPASGSTFPVGPTTVTSTVTDAHGNTQTTTFTVTVNDTEKPGLTVPADITVSNDAGQCSAVVSFTITASDNCPGVTYTSTPASGSTFPEGTTTVNVTATDAHGNSTTKSFTVTVNDTEKPVLSAHADITASNDAGLCSAVVSFTAPTATDNCPGVGVVSSSPASGSIFPVGVTTVTSTVTDAHGNTQTSTFTVTVNDTEKPGLTVPADITVSNDAGLCSAVVSFTAPTATDNCPGVGVVSSSPASGSTFPVGVTTVTSTVTDAHGNTQTSTFTVTVNDTEKPVLSAHANVVANNDPGLCSAVVSFTPATATDNCPGVGVVSSSPASGATFPVGVTTVTNTVTDAHGNTQTSTFTVTVNDTEKPVLSPHANITVSNDAGQCGAVVTFTAPTATDNCPGVGVVSSSPASGATFPVGVTTVTNTVTDAHGNTQTSTFTVTVNDNTPPLLTAPAAVNTTTGLGATICGKMLNDAALGTPVASDNCSVTVVRTGVPAGSIFPVGSTTLTYTATDPSGNMTVKTQIVTVVDNTPPVITVANISVPTSAGLCTGTASLNASATDNCSYTLTGSRSDGLPLLSPYPKGTTTVTWIATDPSGNSSTSAQTVTVTNPPPVAFITAPASGFIVGVGQPVAFAGTFTDNTGDIHTVTWTVDAISFAGTVNEAAFTTAGSFTFTAAGVYTVKMTVKDQCNQTSVATTVGGVDAMIVVYDPSAGFVTGGGWINSPLGAYSADPSLTGRANFGFVSKYKKGQTSIPPEGETEFQFKAGNLNFHSTSYEVLVISGARAQFKGSGTINDAVGYGFLLTSVDGQMSGGGGKDKFRMKIMDKTTGIVVYDSQLGAADSSAASTVLGGGEIVIHTSSGLLSASAPGPESGAPAKNALFQNAPNPFNPETAVRFALAEPGRVTLRVYSVRGELVKTLKDEWLPPGAYQVSWDGRDRNGRAVASGAYFAMISTDRGYRDRIRMVLIK